MKEGTVSVPSCHPCSYCDDDVLPDTGVIVLGGAQNDGYETYVER